MSDFHELVRIVARLRGEDGCPWDKAQTPASMRPYILEETYEVLDAIDQGDDEELRKELGDALFHVVMLAQMASERGAFTIDDVARGVAEKMVSRHPHVFDPNHVHEADAGGSSAWEARKAKERATEASALDGVPRALPSVLRAHRVSDKASAVGFDWPDLGGVRDKVSEELGELDEALASGESDAITEELGDVLFSLVNLGRFLDVGADDALRLATSRFETRFRRLEQHLSARGASVHDTDPDELERIWRAVKHTSEVTSC
ncbi:MAG: nucleoside triphosphate pyrophosphohydrolase [Deltaproteobacteria bacterium]|nr:MAG: nucleoside triphosphate pyrophosphohydrolase [Deltaproteobacteria bacterium]